MVVSLIIVLAVTSALTAIPEAKAFSRVGALTLNSGEDYPVSAVIDSVAGFAYFGTATVPGIIVKVDLSAGLSLDTTSMAIICNPSNVVVNHVTSCFAVVTDTASGPTTPTGTVTFTPGGTCALAGTGTGASATCLVGITPTTVGSLSVSASYGGDTTHDASSGQFLVTVSPGVALTVSSNPTVNSPVTFTATVTGATAPYSFSWDFGDGSGAGTTNPVTHTYTMTGPEVVTVTVTDSAGATAMSSQTVNITGLPLSASFTVSANPTVSSAVTFTATVTGGTAPYTFTWDFGDRSAARTGNPVTHTYTSSGAKIVTLGVTDASGGFTVLDDTWEFRGGAWTQVATSSSPSSRFGASMAYDAADGYALLFGGSNNVGGISVFGDTWEFHAGVWTQLFLSTSPSPRVLASMVYDVADGYVLLFGGLDGNTFPLGDTWEFHAGAWTQLFPSSIPSAGFGSMVYDAADSYVVLFGPGFTTPSDTWEFHAGAWTQLFPSTSPSPRVLASMVYDVADGYVLLFGGSDITNPNTPLGDTWEFLAGAWTQLSPSTSPSPRFASMAYDVADSYVLLFGGNFQPDTWEFNAGVWTQLAPPTSPSPRTAASMVYDAADGSVLLFGGFGPSAPLQSTTTINVAGTITAAQASQNLINLVNSLSLSRSAQTSLLGSLNNIVKILSDQNPTNDISACNKLSSFINMVNIDQTRGILTLEQAAQLRQLATGIMAQLGC